MGKDKTKNSGATRGVVRKRTWFMVCMTAIFLVLLASYALRTSTYLYARITPKLEQLGQKVGGRFEFGSIYAMGLTGIVLKDVQFFPEGMGNASPLQFESVTIYPDLLGMFFGDLNASAIEARGFKATLDMTDTPSSHRTWFLSRREKMASEKAQRSARMEPSASAPSALPDLRCVDCHLELTHDKGRASLHVPWQNVTFSSPDHPWRNILFSGETIQVCLTAEYLPVPGISDTPICVHAASTGLSLEAQSIRFKDLDIGAVTVKPVQLNQLSLKNVELSASDTQHFMSVSDGSIDLDIHGDIPQFGGHYAFEYRELELLHLRDRERIGFGVGVKTTDSTSARIFGGYDRASQLFGITVDSQGLNFAPLLKNASFSQKLTIHKLPVTGKVELRADRIHHTYFLNLSGGIRDAAFSMPVLAKDALSGITGEVDLTATYHAEANRIDVDMKQGRLGAIQFDGTFTRYPSIPDIANTAPEGSPPPHDTRIPFHYDIQLRFSGEAEHFLSSLPPQFIPNLTGYKLSGPYSGQVSLHFDMDDLDALALNLDLDLDGVQTLAFDPRSNFELISTNNFMIRVNAATIPKMIGPREASWASFYDLPRETAYAFIASEDTKFFTHPGLDLRAIRASLIANLKADKVVRGGSTISQQVVKNLFLNHDKTLSRKFQEAFLTWQMEKRLPKLRIFELYINLAHWAKDMYGIRDAARFYFQKNIRELSLRESLFLASILPNPVIFGKQYADNKLSSSRIQKMINIANALYGAKRIDKTTLDETIERLRQNKISDRPRPRID